MTTGPVQTLPERKSACALFSLQGLAFSLRLTESAFARLYAAHRFVCACAMRRLAAALMLLRLGFALAIGLALDAALGVHRTGPQFPRLHEELRPAGVEANQSHLKNLSINHHITISSTEDQPMRPPIVGGGDLDHHPEQGA